MRIVALDLGSRISYCEVKDGQVVARATVSSLSDLAPRLGPNTPPARVAFEACREAWAVHDKLLEWKHQPVMLDTTRVRQLGVGQHRRKNDRIDAETMAKALEVGRVKEAHVLSPRRRELRNQLAVRRELVETRARFVVQIRGLARERGESLPSCEPENFLQRLSETRLSAQLRALVEAPAKVIEVLNPQIKLVEAKLAQLCAGEPVVKRLGSAPGVRLIVAAAFVSVIDDAKRFRRAHDVEAYIGLVPSENTSVHRKLGAITKQGNSYLRSLMVQAAHSVFRLRDDDPLKRWGEAVEQRRGKRIAVIAVARRLVGILWAMWRDGTTYNADKLLRASATGLSKHARELTAEANTQRAIADAPGNRRDDTDASPSACRRAAPKTPREVTMS